MSPSRASRLTIEPLISHSFDIDQADQAYDLVTNGTEPHLGVVLRYPETQAAARITVLPRPAKPKAQNTCVLGVLGAGTFARTKLLPSLKDLPKCRLH